MKPTLEDLDALCAYVNERVVPGNEPGNHCDGTPRYAREFLQCCKPSQEQYLEEYLSAGLGTCDCVLLINYPGIFHEGHGGNHCKSCGDEILLRRECIHGKKPIQ